MHYGTLPLHLYAQVPLPPGAWVSAGAPTDAPAGAPCETTAATTRIVNLEGLVARTRGYVGGPFTQLLHRQPQLAAYVRKTRTSRSLEAADAPPDLIEAVRDALGAAPALPSTIWPVLRLPLLNNSLHRRQKVFQPSP